MQTVLIGKENLLEEMTRACSVYTVQFLQDSKFVNSSRFGLGSSSVAAIKRDVLSLQCCAWQQGGGGLSLW